jgi:hypothetical protein
LLPYSSTRRKRPHCACRIFLNPRTGPGTRCDFGQNGQTKRVPSAFGIRSTITAQPGLHSLYSTGSGGAAALAAGLATGFTAARFTARFTGRARRPAERVDRVRVARMVVASSQPARCLRPDSALSLVLPWALSFRIAPRPKRSSDVGSAKPVTSSARRSCDRCACYGASSCRGSGRPMASAGDCP